MSRMQRLVEDAIRAEHRRAGVLGLSVQGVKVGVNYGYVLLSPFPIIGRSRRSHGLCSKMTSREVVLCGGCNHGRVPRRDPKTRRRIGNPAEWKRHPDCDGTGLRTNLRYGRCGKGRYKTP